MSAPTRRERQAWGRIGGLVVRSRHDPRAYTAPARDAFLESFLAKQAPELPAEEREARAAAARRAHMLQLAEKSAAARRARARG